MAGAADAGGQAAVDVGLWGVSVGAVVFVGGDGAKLVVVGAVAAAAVPDAEGEPAVGGFAVVAFAVEDGTGAQCGAVALPSGFGLAALVVLLQ